MKNTFNNNMALFRKRKGLSQRELAQIVGISHRTIAYYEAETNSIPLDKLENIAEALGVLPGDLVNPVDEKVREKIELDLKLVKKLQQIKQLPDRDQRAISNHINALIDKNRGANG
ncbi:helix-turn-helix domain-containing protein [Spirochaeta isovalerica]|uniref:Transcriptional regulator with XRE-family HTH domain n=1 Tax=Spirochaeta isovalerica TaxID=150 RepID=A0A841RBZ4_9SPIO|nr:transcriptional regulator with XRE-family HTH domain [Spirochaeta isovalerica]MBB6480903.1 transcriptional regulator with XRE-family HTH domain [Spirochaeta isovalerica]